jgi:serine/threonine protein kinase
MAAQPAVHPSEDALRAFALGKLDDATSSVLMSHLDGCPDCCKFLAALSGDDFLNRLRQAQSRSSTPAPAKSLADAAGAAQPPASQTPTPDLPPELAANPQYEIMRELGRGGMGVVYLAKNRLMDRLEVLKVVNKTLLDHPGAVERFLREIRSAAKLSHPNIVGAYSAVQQGELLAFAMEYVEGEDLAKLVKSQGPLPVAHACNYVQQAALGLQHAYEKKMVHRDIKPQNLILTRDGKKHIVKVLDFGLAKATREKQEDTGLTGEGAILGTPDYIAPEQTLDAAKADIRADIYSLGCTLYYLLSGHPPFSASSLGAILMAHHSQEARPLNLVRLEVPEELAAVVRKMMAKDPAKRYQTPLEVVQALGKCLKPSGKSTPPKPSLEVSTEAGAKTVPPPLPAVSVVEAMKQAPVWPEFESFAEGSLTEGNIASVERRKSPSARKLPAPVVKQSSAGKWWVGGGIASGVLLLVLLGMWAGGVFKAKTPATKIEGKEQPTPKIEKREPRKLFKVNRTFHGKWILGDDYLEQTSFEENVWLEFGDPDWKDYDFAVEVMRGEGIEQQVCQGFRWKRGQGMFLYGVGWANNTLFTIEKQRPGKIDLFGRRNGRVDQGKWYKMLVRVRGKHMQCYLNGAKIFDFQSDEHPSGCVALRTWRTKYRFRNINVSAPDGTVLLEGLPDLNHELP